MENTIYMPLSRDDLKALRELSRGTVRFRINAPVAEKLVALGLARQTADGVAITRTGRQHAADARARASPYA